MNKIINIVYILLSVSTLNANVYAYDSFVKYALDNERSNLGVVTNYNIYNTFRESVISETKIPEHITKDIALCLLSTINQKMENYGFILIKDKQYLISKSLQSSEEFFKYYIDITNYILLFYDIFKSLGIEKIYPVITGDTGFIRWKVSNNLTIDWDPEYNMEIKASHYLYNWNKQDESIFKEIDTNQKLKSLLFFNIATNILIEKENITKALELYEKSASFYETASALNNIAVIKSTKENLQKSKKLLEEAKSKEPCNVHVLINLARINNMFNHNEKASQLLDEAAICVDYVPIDQETKEELELYIIINDSRIISALRQQKPISEYDTLFDDREEINQRILSFIQNSNNQDLVKALRCYICSTDKTMFNNPVCTSTKCNNFEDLDLFTKIY